MSVFRTGQFRWLTLPLVLLAVSPALAHHRHTAPAVALTTTGNARLPHLPPTGNNAVGATESGGAMVTVMSPFAHPASLVLSFSGGTNGDPSLAKNGKVIAFATTADPFATGVPGTQVVFATRGKPVQFVIPDPTGTSLDPSVDRDGQVIAFDSTGDLAATGNAGARQVFVHSLRRGDMRQVSRGSGTSRHASVGRRGALVAFESTSDPQTGVDTGTPQIWLTQSVTVPAMPITNGAGASTFPVLSDDWRFLTFESTADLMGDGHDTGVPQVFLYELQTKRFARVTDEPGGCTGASVMFVQLDERIAYRCGTSVFYTNMRANKRWAVEPGSVATGIIPMTDTNFITLATTSDLVNGGTKPTPDVYMVNLFRRPPVSVPSALTWF